jgi:hypothetical protein
VSRVVIGPGVVAQAKAIRVPLADGTLVKAPAGEDSALDRAHHLGPHRVEVSGEV